MNLIKVNLDSKILSKDYKKYKYRFLVKNLFFSLNLKNDTNVIFLTCDGLLDAKDALINSKICMF